jgi:hypothetical protein
MGEKKAKDEKDKILELVEWIDEYELRICRPTDVFSGWGRTLAILVALLFIIAEILNFVTASAADRISIGLASIAVFIAFMSIVIQTGESNMVEGRFKRALKLRKFDDAEKLLVKALIKVKSKNDHFKLKLLYDQNRESRGDMFTEKRLLERLYE